MGNQLRKANQLLCWLCQQSTNKTMIAWCCCPLALAFACALCWRVSGTRLFKEADSVDKIVDDLVRKLKAILDGANNWNEKDGGRRNELAVEAAKNNWTDARELQLQSNSPIPNKLKELYEHTKYWEDKFNNVWGG